MNKFNIYGILNFVSYKLVLIFLLLILKTLEGLVNNKKGLLQNR